MGSKEHKAHASHLVNLSTLKRDFDTTVNVNINIYVLVHLEINNGFCGCHLFGGSTKMCSICTTSWNVGNGNAKINPSWEANGRSGSLEISHL
jgi:hypothetical protein